MAPERVAEASVRVGTDEMRPAPAETLNLVAGTVKYAPPRGALPKPLATVRFIVSDTLTVAV
jgi:hypothetical protein